jgi:hypothetical protein
MFFYFIMFWIIVVLHNLITFNLRHHFCFVYLLYQCWWFEFFISEIDSIRVDESELAEVQITDSDGLLYNSIGSATISEAMDRAVEHVSWYNLLMLFWNDFLFVMEDKWKIYYYCDGMEESFMKIVSVWYWLKMEDWYHLNVDLNGNCYLLVY